MYYILYTGEGVVCFKHSGVPHVQKEGTGGEHG